jgi:putative membrane protein
MKWITEDFQKNLGEKIKSFESKTSIEVVPVVAARSSSYLWPRLFLALANAVIFHFSYSSMTLAAYTWTNFFIFLGFFVFFFFLWNFSPLFRWVFPNNLMMREVEKKALQSFCMEEVFNTRARTGILVFVSILEHKVFVLADKGFTGKVQSDFWPKLGMELAKDFSAHKPGESFFQALEKFIQEVAPHFPANPENPNELPDTLRRH